LQKINSLKKLNKSNDTLYSVLIVRIKDSIYFSMQELNNLETANHVSEFVKKKIWIDLS